jgi:hypothetical protein
VAVAPIEAAARWSQPPVQTAVDFFVFFLVFLFFHLVILEIIKIINAK